MTDTALYGLHTLEQVHAGLADGMTDADLEARSILAALVADASTDTLELIFRGLLEAVDNEHLGASARAG